VTTFALVVPIFDEAERIAEYAAPLVAYLAEQRPGSELVFVDDGSTDDSAALVEALIGRHPQHQIRLMRCPHGGKGAAVTAGLRSTTADQRGFCDIDLSTPLDQLDLIRRAAQRAPVLAIGSRDLPGSRLLRAEGHVRELLGRSFNRLLQATVAPGLVDTQCGAKVASGAIWDAILPHCAEAGFAWDVEVILIARALHIGVQEIPVDWRHDERSKVNVGRDGVAMVWAIPRIWRRARIAKAITARTDAAGAEGEGTGEVFDEDNAEKLAAADRDHWWFRSKAAYVSTALRRTSPPSGERPDSGWLIDAGAGSGGVTALLGWRPDRVAVVEGNGTLVSQAQRFHGLTGLRGDVGALPVADGSVSVVCLLDVIEHVDDPLAALTEAARALAPGGRLVVNVPAHEWLWSAADEELGHVRRYHRRLLRRQLVAAGLEPVIMTHVFSWLVGPVWVTRSLSRGDEAELGLDKTSVAIDRAAMVLTRLERGLIGRVGLPFGTSLLCVAVRHDAAPADAATANAPTTP